MRITLDRIHLPFRPIPQHATAMPAKMTPKMYGHPVVTETRKEEIMLNYITTYLLRKLRGTLPEII